MTTEPTTAREGALTDDDLDSLVDYVILRPADILAEDVLAVITDLRAARAANAAAQEYLDREDAWRYGADDAGNEKGEWLSRRVIFARAELRKRLEVAAKGAGDVG